jgi:hypothetical protein
LAAGITRQVFADGITLADADGAYFGMFPVIFSMGIKNITPAEQTGAEGDYLWSAPAPQTGVETVDSITLEVGDETQAYEFAYVLCRSINITGDCTTGECHCSAELFGRQQIQTTITGAITPPTVELLTAKMARIYVDNTWAGLGGTELVAALVNFDITVNTGVHPKFVGGANRYYETHSQGAITAEATFTLERTAAVAAEELLYRPAVGTYTQTPRFIRLAVTGTQIGAGDNRSLVVDLAGLYTGWHSLGDENEGNNLDVVTLTAGYDVTGTQAIQLDVTTTETAI